MRVGHRAALPTDAATGTGGEGFDPGAHTIPEVLAYLDQHPDQLEAIYTAESDGKARSTLLTELEAREGGS